jgi:2-amino-4-hydroxy-6-hydroxymethyldihydropteridine diphosphokinase
MNTQKTNQERFAYISLGSNLGDSLEILNRAVSELASFSQTPILVSSFWKTTPENCPPDSPAFVNAAVRIAVCEDETPESLLSKLKEMEKRFGRLPKKIHNESRLLDLDIIAFGNEVRNTPELTIPHRLAHQRLFVLKPLQEIAPDFIFAERELSVAELIAKLQSDDGMVKFPTPAINQRKNLSRPE